jgi:LacI family transcriptional regulator
MNNLTDNSKLTLEDVGRMAGVSRSTVSRVINNYPHVRDDVRKRVQKTIKSTGYHANAAARALVTQRSWTIGVVLPRTVHSFFTDPYFPRLIQGIAQACNQLNYTLGLFLISSTEDEEKIFPRISRRSSLDGILFESDQIGDQLIERLAGSHVPMVIIGRPFHAENINYINIDNINSAFMAVEHLIKLGYKRIGTITGPFNTTVGIDRKEGYVKALKNGGQRVDDSLIAQGDFTEADGYKQMQKLLTAKPDAIFAASDIMAIGAMRAVRDSGLSIPGDIAFVGFDDLPLSIPVDPPLTTVHQPVFEFGYKAVEFLIDLMEDGTQPSRHIIMNTELIIRKSCGAFQRK